MAAAVEARQQLRIAILAPHAHIRSPLVIHTPLLADALRRAGCAVTIEAWGRHREGEPMAARVLSRAADIVRLRRRLRATPCDVLLVKTAHDWKTLSRDLPLLWSTRGLCRRRVVQLHGSGADRLVRAGNTAFKRVSHFLLRSCDALFVLSREEQRDWQAFHPGARVYVMRNPFEPRPADPPAQPRSALALPEHVPIVLFVGRLVEFKGLDELLTAAAAVFARRAGHVLIAGEGPERPRLEARVAALGLTAAVTFAGHLDSDLLNAAYGVADIFALPSRWEGFPYAILEAMQAGLPIVTTPIRGMADHLCDGVHGLMVPPGDTRALATALERLLDDGALRAAMGRANRVCVAGFAPDLVAAEQLAILREVLNGEAAKERSSA